jgi:hypothetical protein
MQFLKNLFVNKVFLTIFSVLTTTIITLITVLSFTKKETKEVSFIIDSVEKIASLNIPALQELSIPVGDEKIKELYFLNAKIKNTGTQAVRLEDFYEERISITTQDNSTKFVTFSLDLTPYYRSCQFRSYPHSISLEPDLLNPGDYISVYLSFTQKGKVMLPIWETSIINGNTVVVNNTDL